MAFRPSFAFRLPARSWQQRILRLIWFYTNALIAARWSWSSIALEMQCAPTLGVSAAPSGAAFFSYSTAARPRTQFRQDFDVGPRNSRVRNRLLLGWRRELRLPAHVQHRSSLPTLGLVMGWASAGAQPRAHRASGITRSESDGWRTMPSVLMTHDSMDRVLRMTSTRGVLVVLIRISEIVAVIRI